MVGVTCKPDLNCLQSSWLQHSIARGKGELGPKERGGRYQRVHTLNVTLVLQYHLIHTYSTYTVMMVHAEHTICVCV